MEERRETAGLTMRLIIEYVRRHCGEDAVSRMLPLAGETRPLSVLENEAVWSSYDAKIALFAAAAEVTGEPDVAIRIGGTVLESTVGTSVKVALGLLGSPASLLRVIPRANGKFSTAGEMRAEQVSKTSAVVRYRIKDGFALSHYDCDYALGLLSQVPPLFGLPPAVVEHEQCQVRGADECVYELRWRRHHLRGTSRRRKSIPTEALLSRLHELQETLGDLVAVTHVDDVLDAIAGRAGTAVSAERFVLTVRLDAAEQVRVRYDGFDAGTAQAVADALVAGETVRVGSDHAMVVEVRTATRRYGHLAAFARYPFLEHETELLEAYARLAATALDAVTALAAAEERRGAAEALLSLASDLQRAHTSSDVAEAVADAAQTVVDADAAGFLLLDPTEETLRVAGHSGFSDDVAPLVSALSVRPHDTPELEDLLAHPNRPRLYDDQCPDEFIRGLLQILALRLIAVLPVNGHERMHGVLIVGWFTGSKVPVVGPALFARLAGLADQATNALEKTELVRQVHAQATTDALTGVGNRRLLTERLREAIETATAETQTALLFMDLDRFKVVNDTLGHAAGDELLITVAARIANCVRTDDLVARLGGDEFTVLLPTVSGPAAAVDLAERIIGAMYEPVHVQGRTLHVRPSIGVLCVSSPDVTVSEALRDADAAMYAAKKAGGNRCVLFDPERFRSDSDALDLESDLYAAVTEERLHLDFQPQVDLMTGQTIGVEVLARWQHPTRGLVPPDRFLPVAEATGLIAPLDLWVMRTACFQGADWWARGQELRVAVNVSARTLTDPRFVPTVVEALATSGLPARALEVELTEATAIADTETVRAVLAALRSHGVSVAVDDLGTGYSSLSWISSFPVDRIKIDRSFVADLDSGGRGEPLVEALIAMAHRLGHGVLAEGVETPAQVRRLVELGCTEAQGYVLGRPGPAAAVVDIRALPSGAVALKPRIALRPPTS